MHDRRRNHHSRAIAFLVATIPRPEPEHFHCIYFRHDHNPWTPFSFIVVNLARQIRAGEITFSGVNSTLPMLACLLAKRAYDFDFTYINVAGGVEPQPVSIPLSSSDPAIVAGSPAIFANQDFYDLCARGGLDLV